MTSLYPALRNYQFNQGANWSPLMLSGLVLWLDSNLGITTDTTAGTTTVATWANQAPTTGSGYDAAQATKANQPLYVAGVLNGFPGVQFDGSNDTLGLSGAGLGIAQNIAGLTVATVVKNPAATVVGNKTIWAASINSSAGVRVLGGFRNSNQYRFGARAPLDGSTFVEIGSNNGTITNAASQVSIYVNNFTTNVAAIYHNGTAVNVGTAIGAATGSLPNTASQQVTIGGLPGSQFIDCTIMSIIACQSVLLILVLW